MADFVGNNNANTLVGTPDNDSFQARGGNDSISGGGGNDSIDAGAGNDTARGGGGNDTIDAGSGADTASGGGGNDTIAGGSGNDLLAAGDGDNILTGGPGADTFEIDLDAEPGDTINLITDFEDGLDQIHLLFDGAPLGAAKVDAIEDVADNSDPTNALNAEDSTIVPEGEVNLLDGDIFDILQLDFFFFPAALDSGDVLNVAGVSQLELDAQAGGTDLFLV